MQNFVDISFDCLPLRSVTRMDIPIDASPKYRARCERIKQAIEDHGTHNTYYLYNAKCIFHLTNKPEVGMLEYRFEGTAMTDPTDQKTIDSDLSIELVRETCDWLTEPAVEWFLDTVDHAVQIEFDRYIAAGDLAQTLERLKRLQAEHEQQGGYLGMYL